MKDKKKEIKEPVKGGQKPEIKKPAAQPKKSSSCCG